MSAFKGSGQLALDLTHPNGHYEALHVAQHGTVLLWEKLAPAKRWHKLEPNDPTIPALLAAQEGQLDRFVSVNEFHGWRFVRLLKSLRAVYLDVDGCTDLELVLEALRDARMPPPSAVVFSGNGLHLYWLLEAVPAKALPAWQAITDRLYRAMEAVGADAAAKDCTRVLRLPGTINARGDHEVRGLVLTGARWTLHELADEVLGARPPKKSTAEVRDLAAAKARRGGRTSTGSIYDRWHAVYADCCAIGDWHIMGGVPEGHRHKWLFVATVALSWFTTPASLERELLHTARQWTPSLPLTDVLASIRPILQRAKDAAEGKTVEWQGMKVDPRYRFRRQTLYDWLAPIIPPEIAPKLRAIVPDDVAEERKAERDAARWRDHYTGAGFRGSNAEAFHIAQGMRADGKSHRLIAEALGVSHTTVRKWLEKGGN